MTITQQQRQDLTLAAVDCEHQIDADCVRLWRDETKEGSALSQLVDRVVAAVAQSAPTDYDAHQKNGLAWAVDCWAQEVKNRPLINAHRRTLDDTWRQVIRYFGGDPEKLIGPSHDALMSKGE